MPVVPKTKTPKTKTPKTKTPNPNQIWNLNMKTTWRREVAEALRFLVYCRQISSRETLQNCRMKFAVQVSGCRLGLIRVRGLRFRGLCFRGLRSSVFVFGVFVFGTTPKCPNRHFVFHRTSTYALSNPFRHRLFSRIINHSTVSLTIPLGD